MKKTIREAESTPKKDGYWMPGEFEPQECIYMAWPHRTATWQGGAKPVQKTFENVAKTIAEFEPVVMCVRAEDYENARAQFEGVENVTIVEMDSDDAWMRDMGPTFVRNADGDVRAVHWHFNSWGGLYDGFYFPWDKDGLVGMKVADHANVDRYRPDDFVLEGGSIHVDGEGTILTTEMCLLSPGRNPKLSKEQIEEYLKEYLGGEKVIWLKDGIDPDVTNGHIDDVACFVRPGEVALIWTEDETNPFYATSREAYKTLSETTDAKGRTLKIHKVTLPKELTYMTDEQVATIDLSDNSKPFSSEWPCIASYLNFLIVNDGIIAPQYHDEYDEVALKQLQEIFPDRKVVGVDTLEVVYGGGNVHCITQQLPKARA